MSEETKLIAITGTNNTNRQADVVFVHGLGGDAWSTWHPYESKDDHHFWLKWLGEDLPDAGIWSLAYQVEPFKKDGHTMSLKKRATNVLSLLKTKKIGERPVLFITHSMGGLLVKQMLRNIYDFAKPEWKKIGEQTKGIVFISTPHSGSDLATWLDFFDFMGAILGISESVKELKADNSLLKELNQYFRQHHDLAKIPIQVFYETKETSREKRILGFLKTFAAIVVDEASANPEMTGVVPIPLDEDHLSICRPKSNTSQIYDEVKQFIEKCLSNSSDNLQIDEKVVESTNVESSLGTRNIYINQGNYNEKINGDYIQESQGQTKNQSSTNTRRKFYTKRIAAKQEELAAIDAQLAGTLSDQDEVKLNRTAEKLLEEIEALEAKLNE